MDYLTRVTEFPIFPPVFFDLFVIAVATWRLSALLTAENGPWNIFLRLRFWWKGGPMLCIKCMSGWVCPSLIAIYYLLPNYWGRWFVFWLAAWGLALMLKSFTGVGHD